MKARASKVCSLEAAASGVKSGCSVALGGIHSHNSSMALLRQIIKNGTKHLTLIPSVSAGMPTDLLIGAGCVDAIYATYVGLEHFGLARNFRRAVENGSLIVKDVCEPFTVYGMKAGAASLPFIPVPAGHEAMDNPSVNPEYKTVTDPYTGKSVLVVPPLNPDVGLIHVPRCDPYGNAQILGSIVQDDLIAKSSRTVIVTTEEIVPLADTVAHSKAVVIPGFLVDMVVEVPYGAHPCSCHGCYGYDTEALLEYRDSDIRAYLDKYVYGPSDHYEYLEHFGLRRLASLRALGRSKDE